MKKHYDFVVGSKIQLSTLCIFENCKIGSSLCSLCEHHINLNIDEQYVECTKYNDLYNKESLNQKT